MVPVNLQFGIFAALNDHIFLIPACHITILWPNGHPLSFQMVQPREHCFFRKDATQGICTPPGKPSGCNALGKSMKLNRFTQASLLGRESLPCLVIIEHSDLCNLSLRSVNIFDLILKGVCRFTHVARLGRRLRHFKKERRRHSCIYLVGLRSSGLNLTVWRGCGFFHVTDTIQEPLQRHLRKMFVDGIDHLKGGPCLVVEHTAQRSFRNSGELREDFWVM